MVEHNMCILDHLGDDDVFIDMSDSALWKQNNVVHTFERYVTATTTILDLLPTPSLLFLTFHFISTSHLSSHITHLTLRSHNSPSALGMYELLFTRCEPTGGHLVSFNMHAKLYNPGNDRSTDKTH
jgi:hypothetical protein